MELVKEILERQQRIDREREELKALVRLWMEAKRLEAA